MDEEQEKHEISGPGNTYGGLSIRLMESGNCQWSVEDYNGHDWFNIPRSLYDAILTHEKEQTNDTNT